jgi:hypothetical protein
MSAINLYQTPFEKSKVAMMPQSNNVFMSMNNITSYTPFSYTFRFSPFAIVAHNVKYWEHLWRQECHTDYTKIDCAHVGGFYPG